MSQLEENEHFIAREMLRQEAGAFARNDYDFGCVENLELEIQLKDNAPAQKNYISIPIAKPLYGVTGFASPVRITPHPWSAFEKKMGACDYVSIIENKPRTAADSSDTRHLKWSGRQQMVYSS